LFLIFKTTGAYFIVSYLYIFLMEYLLDLSIVLLEHFE